MPDGNMKWYTDSKDLDGYPGCGTIKFEYEFKDGHYNKNGTQTKYEGTSRYCYLPNNSEGQEVLKLLIECFKRRHSFTIGTSLTHNRDNCVVWSGIHHKTSTTGGQYGYPDATYIDRVTDEINGREITSSDVQNMNVNFGSGSVKVSESGIEEQGVTYS